MPASPAEGLALEVRFIDDDEWNTADTQPDVAFPTAVLAQLPVDWSHERGSCCVVRYGFDVLFPAG